MRCCVNKNTKEVKLAFSREQLLYDIGNSAYVEADIMNKERENARTQTYDIIQEGNVDRVTRILNLAHSECIEFLYPFSKKAVVDDDSRVDYLTEIQIYHIFLTVPESFSRTTLSLLENYIHEYMVCRVLYDWLSTTKPEAAEVWKNKMEDAKESILDAKSIRITKVRRGMSPF